MNITNENQPSIPLLLAENALEQYRRHSMKF